MKNLNTPQESLQYDENINQKEWLQKTFPEISQEYEKIVHFSPICTQENEELLTKTVISLKNYPDMHEHILTNLATTALAVEHIYQNYQGKVQVCVREAAEGYTGDISSEENQADS